MADYDRLKNCCDRCREVATDMERAEMVSTAEEFDADPARIRTALTLLRLYEKGWDFTVGDSEEDERLEYGAWSEPMDALIVNPTPEATINAAEAIEAAEKERES